MQGSQIAIEMATAILTTHGVDGPTECNRAQMMLERASHKQTIMGGRNKQSIVDEIDAVLAAHGFTTGDSK